ncbi:MAG TPA: DUF177 domain-containing protein [Vicinamibacterales bacterium]|jgi:uncharacterized protein
MSQERASMQLDLSHLGRRARGDEHVDRTFEASDFHTSDEDGYRIAAPAHLVMDVQKDRDAFRVTGRVATTLELECGRCLERFQVPVNSPFELRYVSVAHNAGDGEREIGEDDLSTTYYKDDALDVEDLMREQFQLALPMKPLCSETCQGLCPECGTNLNTAACSCAPKWEDPRLGALKGLLGEKKE